MRPFYQYLEPTGRGKWPSGMTLHLPLTSNLLPLVGSGGAVAITRAGEKRTQTGLNTFAVDATNTLSITKNFLGISGATGLLPELAVTNDVTYSDDMRVLWAVAGITLTGSDPVSVTVTGHPFNTGESVTFASVGGTTELNGNSYTITDTGANSFTLDGTDSSAFSAWTSGGTATGGWSGSNCTVSAKNVTDPAGVANQAQTLTPSAAGGYIQNATAAACSSKNAYADCYLRRAAGAAGSHTGQLVVTDSAGTVVATKDITITADYQRFFHEYTGTGGGAETLIFRIVPDKNATQAVDARMPFVEVFANTSIKTLPTSTLGTRAVDVGAQDCSANVRGDVGTFCFEVVPMHDPEDGVSHVYFSVNPLKDVTRADLHFYKSVAGDLTAKYYVTGVGDQVTTLIAANSTNWARGVRHKVAIRYSAAGGLNFYFDGTAGGTLAGAIVVGDAAPPATCKFKPHYYSNTIQPNAIISGVRFWPRVLTDAEMVRVTT